MAKTTKKLKKLPPKIEKLFSSGEVGVLLEHLETNICLITERHIDLDRKIDNLGKELNGKIDILLDNRIDSLENKMDSFENRMGKFENRMGTMEQEMRSGFKTIITFLTALEKEVA